MLKNKIESYVRIGGRGLKNLTYPYMGVGGIKNFQNHAYVINEWSLIVQEEFHIAIFSTHTTINKKIYIRT